MNQNFQHPFDAIVIDPVRTISAGKVNLGAFRTYPKGYKPPDEGPSEYQTIPLNKIEDFGVHCKSYYQLEVSYFKSPMDTKLLDSLWNHYWVNTLSASSLITNAEYTTGEFTYKYIFKFFPNFSANSQREMFPLLKRNFPFKTCKLGRHFG